MASKNFQKCEYCGRKVKKSNYLKHKAKVHPKQLSEKERRGLKGRKRVEYKIFWDTWSGLTGEAIAEIKKLKASTIEEHVEKAALLEWMKKTLCEDPYWIKPTKRIGDEEYNAWLNRLRKFENKYPSWVTDLGSAMPTYYGVLGVARRASPEKVERQYHMKKENHSSYPGEVLDRARAALTNERSKKKYDSLLKIVNYLNKGLYKEERKEAIEDHDSWIKHENSIMIMEYIGRENSGWETVSILGGPTFYDIMGIDGWKAKKVEEKRIKEAFENRKGLYPHASELLEEIRRVLSNPILRWEYEFMLSFLEDGLEHGDRNDVEPRRDAWKTWDDKWKFLLYLLGERNAGENFQRWLEINKKQGDWEGYLPPNEQSLYTILGVGGDRVSPHDGNISSFLRDRYRRSERTPEVNLAYSILKNKNHRKDYDWMLENNEPMRQMFEIYKIGGKDIGEEEMREMMFEDIVRAFTDDFEY